MKVFTGKPGASTPGVGATDDTEIEMPSIITTPVDALKEKRELPVPGINMTTVAENQALIDQDVYGVELAQPSQDIPEGPPLPESEDEYGNVNNVAQNIFTLNLWDDNTPTDALPQATQEIEDQQTREDKSREQERIKSIPELFSDESKNITTLAGVRAAINNQPDNLMHGPLNRAARLAKGIKKTSMTAKELKKWQESKDPNKAFTVRQLGIDADWEAKFPALKVAEVETNQQTICIPSMISQRQFEFERFRAQIYLEL